MVGELCFICVLNTVLKTFVSTISVLGMSVSDEFVYWEDERAMNMNTQGGLYPSVMRSKYPKKYTKVYYCYYTKAPPNRNVKTLFTVLYVIAGVAGAIVFLLVLLGIIQRIANRKNKQFYDDHNVTSAARERMIRPRDPEHDPPADPAPARRPLPTPRPLPEPIVEYRPPEYATHGAGPRDGSVLFSHEKKQFPFPMCNGLDGVDGACGSGSGSENGLLLGGPHGGPHGGPRADAGCSGSGATSVVVPTLESPTNDGPTSISSAEEHTPMLQPPPFDGARAMSPQPGAALDFPRPISQPPSYEEVLREDGKLPTS